MKTKTCTLEIEITASEDDVLFLPVGRDITKVSIKKQKTSLETEPEELPTAIEKIPEIVDTYGNSYLPFNLSRGDRILYSRVVEPFPRKPNIEPSRCLENDERFCKWRLGGYVEKLVSKVGSIPAREKVLRFGTLIKEIGYIHPRTSYEYTDDVLKDKLKQDCLGMHAVLCAMLRCSGVPAVVDIGFRLDGDDQPHVWLWYFDDDKQDWVMVDLNDSGFAVMIGDEIMTPRMSVSLGTTHVVNGFTISFVQYLVSQKMLEGELKDAHKIVSNVHRNIE